MMLHRRYFVVGKSAILNTIIVCVFVVSLLIETGFYSQRELDVTQLDDDETLQQADHDQKTL